MGWVGVGCQKSDLALWRASERFLWHVGRAGLERDSARRVRAGAGLIAA